MRLEEGRKVGMRVVEAMAPGCDRAMIAGSVRRGVAMVKDVEVVYISRVVEEQVDLFTRGAVMVAERVIFDLVHQGFWQLDDVVRRNGPRYKRMVQYMVAGEGVERVVVELFRAEVGNWGLQLVLRTGPAEFNKVLVNRFGGAMPVNMCMRDGWLWRAGVRLETRTEDVFFGEIGLPYWEPGERSGELLKSWLRMR